MKLFYLKACILIFIIFLVISCNIINDKITPSDFESYVSLSKDEMPAISPDGKLIVFYHTKLSDTIESSQTGLYIMNSDGSDKRLFLSGVNITPCWSPDSKWIAYSTNGIINIIDLMRDSLRTFQNDLYFISPDWSSDGTKILLTAPLTLDGGVYVISPDFSFYKRLFNPLYNNGNDAKWSPDMKKIIYIKGNQQWEHLEIFTIDSSLENEIRLTNDTRDDRDVVWSPDGKKIAWASDVVISVMDSNGKNVKRLDYGLFPCWSPDGTCLIYCNANRDYSKEVLWKINIETREKIQLTF
jgi:TolB protein